MAGLWEGAYPSATTYDMNENGRILTYQRSEVHDTDPHAQTAESFVRQTAGGAPSFMYLSPNAPHHPSYCAPRHSGTSSETETPLPKPSSFNEAGVSDKPQWVRNKLRLSSTEVSDLTDLYGKRLRAPQSLDEMVARSVNTLSETV